MKYLAFIAVLCVFSMPAVLHAQEVAASDEVVSATTTLATPRLLPGNPFYFLKTFKERAQMALTFNDERRAERAAAFAEERKAEYAALTLEGRAERVEKAAERMQAAEEKLQERIEAIREQNPEAAAKIEERIERQREALKARLEQNLETLLERDVRSNRTEVLKERLENAPEAARPGLERALGAPTSSRPLPTGRGIDGVVEPPSHRYTPPTDRPAATTTPRPVPMRTAPVERSR